MKTEKLFICLLCCGRVDLLKETLISFKEKCLDLKNYELYFIVSDDSGDSLLNEKIKDTVESIYFESRQGENYRFGPNVGQAASFWKCVENIKKFNPKDNDIIFILEEDWLFVEPFTIDELNCGLNDKIQGEKICSMTLKSDVDNFDDFKRQGYNLVDHNEYFVIAPANLSHLASSRGNCIHNEIICFHPGALQWRNVSPYAEVYEYDSLIHIKESAEKLLGLVALGLRAYIKKNIYSKHIGDYRLHSVFPGAKIRKGVSMKSVTELLSKFR